MIWGNPEPGFPRKWLTLPLSQTYRCPRLIDFLSQKEADEATTLTSSRLKIPPRSGSAWFADVFCFCIGDKIDMDRNFIHLAIMYLLINITFGT